MYVDNIKKNKVGNKTTTKDKTQQKQKCGKYM